MYAIRSYYEFRAVAPRIGQLSAIAWLSVGIFAEAVEFVGNRQFDADDPPLPTRVSARFGDSYNFV